MATTGTKIVNEVQNEYVIKVEKTNENIGEELPKNKGKKILTIMGWLSALLSFCFFSAFLGALAISIGVVLRRGYQGEKKGLALIIMGVKGEVNNLRIGLKKGLFFREFKVRAKTNLYQLLTYQPFHEFLFLHGMLVFRIPDRVSDHVKFLVQYRERSAQLIEKIIEVKQKDITNDLKKNYRISKKCWNLSKNNRVRCQISM